MKANVDFQIIHISSIPIENKFFRTFLLLVTEKRRKKSIDTDAFCVDRARHFLEGGINIFHCYARVRSLQSFPPAAVGN